MKTTLKIGDSKLSPCEEQITQFLDRIDEYIENKNLSPPSYSDEFREVEQLSLEDIRRLPRDECFNYSLMMLNYADHVNSERARNDSVVQYCDRWLNKIIGRDFLDFQNVYANVDIKTQMIIKENTVAQKLVDFKAVAESRNLSLKNKEFNVRKKADCLLEKGRKL